MDAQLQVVRKLEEKERLLQGTISAAERELALRTQALDMNKRKVYSSLCVCVCEAAHECQCRLFRAYDISFYFITQKCQHKFCTQFAV